MNSGGTAIVSSNLNATNAKLSIIGLNPISIIVNSSSQLSILTVGTNTGTELTIGNNIILQGSIGNTQPLVYVSTNGIFTMKNESKLIGNNAGGVEIFGGTFIMDGGEISGNFRSSTAGGVYVSTGSTFTMNGGTITGNTATGGGTGGGVTIGAGGTFNGIGSIGPFPNAYIFGNNPDDVAQF
jgi:hypothetical protein